MTNTVVRGHRHGWWWKTLLAGFGLWVVTIVVTGATGNVNLIPTLILLGSFLVPFCVVLFAVERVAGTFAPIQLILAFFFGGVFGVLGASLLESDLHASPWIYFRVGFIEEFVKAVILLLIGRSVVPKSAPQGALLGACVGAGFAAFESAGYAFNAAVTTSGIDLASLLQTEVMRSVLTPVGHVLWTALLGAVLFGAAAGAGRYRFTRGVVFAFVGVSILHGLWDSMGGIAALLAFVATGNAIPALEYGFLRPGTDAEVASLSSTFYVVGLIVVSVIGLLALRVTLRRRRFRAN
ncbi:PrsW family intramembrane metalloprotease [Arthrobacter sp. ISL-85]|uniref:PrsW family intramembrane metalloprotease n=1 Tax=Arthrobacter sp. ISL-85 TaxID=2819115 RepID=UPI001BECAB88|nr:PrsW family glutamic-type intramembrane protease [Arthrobacter sp. ISL-85]MBT2567177.1 PrsW family intramembrane metalloprotease [Arthrobacter sp. ISL-85]